MRFYISDEFEGDQAVSREPETVARGRETSPGALKRRQEARSREMLPETGKRRRDPLYFAGKHRQEPENLAGSRCTLLEESTESGTRSASRFG